MHRIHKFVLPCTTLAGRKHTDLHVETEVGTVIRIAVARCARTTARVRVGVLSLTVRRSISASIHFVPPQLQQVHKLKPQGDGRVVVSQIPCLPVQFTWFIHARDEHAGSSASAT